MTPRDQILSAVKGLRVAYAPRWDDPGIAGRGVFSPRVVMLHHTAGTDSLAYITSGPVRAGVPGAHFLVARDGLVHVLSRSVTYHAGRGGPRWGIPAGMANLAAWGIEIEDLGRGLTMTEAQIDATARLTAGLIRAMHRDLDAVVQHKEWNPAGKVDTRYETSFWRDRVARHLTPPSEPQEDDDMALSDKMKVPAVFRDLIGAEEVTVEEVLIRLLALAKRDERKNAERAAAAAARDAGLKAAVEVAVASAPEGVRQAVAEALDRYLGGPLPAEVRISVGQSSPPPA